MLNPAPLLHRADSNDIVVEHAAPELSVHYKSSAVVQKQSFSMQIQKIFVPNEETNAKGGMYRVLMTTWNAIGCRQCCWYMCCCYYYMLCCCCCESNSRTITKQKFVSRFQKWVHISGKVGIIQEISLFRRGTAARLAKTL